MMYNCSNFICIYYSESNGENYLWELEINNKANFKYALSADEQGY